MLAATTLVLAGALVPTAQAERPWEPTVTAKSYRVPGTDAPRRHAPVSTPKGTKLPSVAWPTGRASIAAQAASEARGARATNLPLKIAAENGAPPVRAWDIEVLQED